MFACKTTHPRPGLRSAFSLSVCYLYRFLPHLVAVPFETYDLPAQHLRARAASRILQWLLDSSTWKGHVTSDYLSWVKRIMWPWWNWRSQTCFPWRRDEPDPSGNTSNLAHTLHEFFKPLYAREHRKQYEKSSDNWVETMSNMYYKNYYPEYIEWNLSFISNRFNYLNRYRIIQTFFLGQFWWVAFLFNFLHFI